MRRTQANGMPARGFTLIEMAIAMAIFALLLGGGIMIFTKQQELSREKDAIDLLAAAKEALIGFAQANGRLPCPDADGDGREDPAGGGVCNNDFGGNLPAATLGIANGADGLLHDPQSAAPNNRFRYAVSDCNSHAATSPGGIKGVGMAYFGCVSFLRICPAAGCATWQDAVAVLLAPGRNANAYPGGDSPDEQANYDGNRDFVATQVRAHEEGGGGFDDRLAWIPPALLANKMIAAGQLP